MDGAGSAPAQGLDLEHLHPVGELDEPLAAREELGAEVRGDPEGMDVDVELIDNACQLVDLLGPIELRLVADEVVHAQPTRQRTDDVLPEVEVVGHLDRGHRQPESAGEDRFPHPVELGEDQSDPPSGAVVVAHLEGQGGLAAVHRPGEEDQFCHDSAA